MNFKDIIKITLNLIVIYIIGGLLLAGVYAKTSPIIFQKSKEEKELALKQMISEAQTIIKPENGDWSIDFNNKPKHVEYFEAKTDNQIIGYVVESYGKGYSSFINILVAVDKDLKITKMNILQHAETPGLGDGIENPSFKDQFIGKDLDHLVLVKGEANGNIAAITGATISSRAVTKGVRAGVEMLTKVVGQHSNGLSEQTIGVSGVNNEQH
ncbi:MAG: RnfABCDGE type electron transport complex subunit G [Nitrospirae bacterium]|nr:RnfABCDGE type electron transport complex subunit G [Nitrospirota bacterium]MBF0542502.1 RnfABCDGE type electron transport complex subunit G [Nitrospirota bacterium]